MIKTIIFDLGNVIVPFDIEVGLNNLANACDLTNAEVREKLLRENHSQDFHEGKTKANELFENVRKSLRLRLNFEEFVDAWNSIFSFEPILSEELIELLSKKYRLIILSDTNQLHFDFIKPKFPVLNYFDAFVLSHKVGAVKPLPKMYQAAVKQAECIAKECFFTDDKLENVAGAKEFGINAVQFLSAKRFEKDLVKFGVIENMLA